MDGQSVRRGQQLAERSEVVPVEGIRNGSAAGIVVSTALCARPGRPLLSAGRPDRTDRGTTNRRARASPQPQLHV